MSRDNHNLHEVIEELADALQTAVLLAAKLATGLRRDCHDADLVYESISRATTALRRLTPTSGGTD